MCGISGCVMPGAPAGAAAGVVQRMCDAIAHRGPDDWGYVARDPAAIGMRRLSIIDVAGGHQPIPNEDDSAWIVFNGEIYNHHALRTRLEARGHRFRTRSDTETILHGYEEWGDDVVRELHGMFTFAIWDEPRQRLVVARDHLGIKPLYYWHGADGLVFSSEMRSFLALDDFPRALSHEALLAYLALGYVPHPLSIFAAARKLEPGSLLTWSEADGLATRRYWDPAAIAPAEIDGPVAVKALRAHLAEAVASHLESEVPLGAFLSGGLDSSTVVALMCRASTRRVRTFSIGFRESAFDESSHAAEVAAVLGTDHTAVTLDPSAEVLLERVSTIYDEPFADASALPTYLVSALAREHVTVSLSGDGGDELFGGYRWYAALANRRVSAAPWHPAMRWVGRRWPSGVPGRGRMLDLSGSRIERMNARHVLPLGAEDGGPAPDRVATAAPRLDQWFLRDWQRVADRDFVHQMTVIDLLNYMPGDILTKVDRASMAVSLEARVPLLHLPLVEFALSLPGSLKVRGGVTKAVFREAVREYVPPAVLQHRKQGFSVPLGAWFRSDLKPLLSGLSHLPDQVPGVLDRAAIGVIIRRHLDRQGDQSPMLWRLLVLQRWLGHLESGLLARPIEPAHLADLMRTRTVVGA